MKSEDSVKLKSDFEEELEQLGFCKMYLYFVSKGFENGPLKISHIRHDDEFDMDFAVFSPFLEVPVQCLELAQK